MGVGIAKPFEQITKEDLQNYFAAESGHHNLRHFATEVCL
jgi:hypothetical protein